MTRRFVRLTLFAVLVLALGATAYRIALLERWLAAEETRADAAARAATGAIDALLELRAAQRAYVAEGQGAAYWGTRAQDAVTRLKNDVDTFSRTIGPTTARATLEGSAEALSRLTRLEDRIGEHALAGRRAHAEDLIFADSVEASTAVERDLRAAAAMAVDESRQRTRALREQELIVLGLAGAVALLIALLLLPVARQPQAATVRASGDRAEAPDLPLNLRGGQASVPAPVTPPVAPIAGPSPVPSPAGPPLSRSDRAAAARLHAAADLCAALARVQHAHDLPALLAHIGRVLDAQGLIVWMSDAASRTLSPALAHGYRDTALARMGTIGWDDQSPAAEAFRRGEARLVEPANDLPAAVIVPLLSPAGCVGVVTVELVTGSKRDAAALDLARIFGAQLAGLIAPAAQPEPAAETPKVTAGP